MKKTGGVALIAIGAILIIIAVLRAIGVLLALTGEEQTAYGMGFIAGASFIVILLTLIGLKAIKKGRTLFNYQTVSTE